MSMHLCPAYVTTTVSRRKNKPKSAKQIQVENDRDEHLFKLARKHGINLDAGKNKSKVFKGVEPKSYQRETINYPSLDSNTWTAAKKENIHYSGERKLLGIAVMHKSNLVPVFSKE